MAQEILWTHPSPSSTNVHKFMSSINKKYGQSLSSYGDLHKWSIDHSDQFWSETESWVGIDWDQSYDQVRWSN